MLRIEGLTGHGEVECDGSCVYTPPAGPLDYPYQASFRYWIDDGHPGAESFADVLITLNANNSPIARKDGMTAPGVATGYSVAGIVAPLVNDTDRDGDQIAISGWSSRRADSHGDVVCLPPEPGLPWRCLYSADPGFTGPDWFTYTISDGHGAPPPDDNGFATARIDVTVTADRAPRAFPDTRVAHGRSILSLNLLGNDSDPDDDEIGVISVTPVIDPAGGSIDCSTDCTYTPPAVFAGQSVQHFTYTIGDGRGGTATSSFDIRLIDNVGPTALDDRASARFGDPVSIDVLGNDSDPEGDRLTVSLLTDPVVDGVVVPQPLHGLVTCGTSDCSYDAPPGFFGDDQFAYRITDESGATDWAVVTVTVVQNRRPTTVDDVVTVALGTHLPFDPTQNDGDPDDDAIRLIASTQPSRGKVLCEQGCIYVPDGNAAADVPFTTTFTYTITDDRGGERDGTVTVHVVANQPPEAHGDELPVMEHVTAWLDVVVNDTDAEHDILTIISNTDPDHGTVDCTKAPGGQSATPAPSLRLHPGGGLHGPVAARGFLHVHDQRPA